MQQFNGYFYSRRIYKGRLLKQAISGAGYKKVVLYNKTSKSFLVHRLVAETFIPNPNNFTQVNHIDENKENNCVSNLEWCNSKYNINYGNRNVKVTNALKGKPKSEEHRKKLSDSAKKRIRPRDNKGRFF